LLVGLLHDVAPADAVASHLRRIGLDIGFAADEVDADVVDVSTTLFVTWKSVTLPFSVSASLRYGSQSWMWLPSMTRFEIGVGSVRRR
jgi:hypothetical protein